MRLILRGSGSFIARHVQEAALAAGHECITLRHGDPLQRVLSVRDVVINFALPPSYKTASCPAEADWDIQTASACQAKGARFVMLSSRRVYPAEHAWNAAETDQATGDHTFYGQNKAQGEIGVRAQAPESLILRLSNIIGFEYNPGRLRTTFAGQMLNNLKNRQKIVFDMHPDTKRDFLPAPVCAEIIVRSIETGLSGIYNLGAGFPQRCGEIAEWVMRGYGAGALQVDNARLHDAFFLDTSRLRAETGANFTPQELERYCVTLGLELAHA